MNKFIEWSKSSLSQVFSKISGREPSDHSVGNTTPEILCGIDPSAMSVDEIRSTLAQLYKRHNQAAGSLNSELREEAEKMLDAIVHCREKYVDGAE